jgi:purine catabolism regulator
MITVDLILGLSAVTVGAPEVLAGGDKLDNPVRWVHVTDVKSLAGILEGGELVLTTGLAFNESRDEAARYLSELTELSAAGVIVELTDDRGSARTALREAARSASIPVILVSRRIKFVEVTQVVHRMIVAAQLEQVEKARYVHEVFTQLSLESAGPKEVVARTAHLIGAPVLLEDVFHRVMAFESLGGNASELLRDWKQRSGQVHFREETVRSGEAHWLQAPVGLRGRRWGRLVVPDGVEDEPDAVMVLERASQALSINRLAERDERELTSQAQAGLLHELRQPRSLDETEALARASALGLHHAPLYLPVVIRLDRRPGEEPVELQRRERVLLELLHQVLSSSSNTALAASLQTGSVAMLLALPARQLEEPLLERICGELEEQVQAAGNLRWHVGVGRACQALLEAAGVLDEAHHVAEIASTIPPEGRKYYRFTDVRLRGLLALLRNDPRAASFANAELSGLLETGDLQQLDLLERYLACGGNKAELARSGYLSRPTLYSRLAKLEKRLGVPLEDPESRTSLHVAVLLYRLRGL